MGWISRWGSLWIVSPLVSSLNFWWNHHPGPLAVLQSNFDKTVWYWYNDKQVDQWNRIEDPEMNPHTYGHLIFNKGAKTIQWKKESIFNKWCWHKWQLLCRRMWIHPLLSLCTKLMSKWIKELHIKLEKLKLIQEKMGKSLTDMVTGEEIPEQNSNGLCYKI